MLEQTQNLLKIPRFVILLPASPGAAPVLAPRVTGPWPGPGLAPVWPRHQEGVHAVITRASESPVVITRGAALYRGSSRQIIMGPITLLQGSGGQQWVADLIRMTL